VINVTEQMGFIPFRYIVLNPEQFKNDCYCSAVINYRLKR